MTHSFHQVFLRNFLLVLNSRVALIPLYYSSDIITALLSFVFILMVSLYFIPYIKKVFNIYYLITLYIPYIVINKAKGKVI